MARKTTPGTKQNLLICDRCVTTTEDGSHKSMKWYKEQINKNNVFTICYCPKCASHHIVSIINYVKEDNPKMRFPLILQMLGLNADDISHHSDVFILKMVKQNYANYQKLKIK